MSLKDLMKKGDDAAAAKIEKKPDSGPKRPVTSPGATALMAPTIDALKARATEAEGRAVELEAKLAVLQESGEGATKIGVSLIGPNPWQPRRVFAEAELQKLAGSIAEVGLIQPIVVRSVPNMDTPPTSANRVPNMDTRYQIVAGERRWRAHKLLELADIKAIVIEASDDEMVALALAENFDREDLTAYEIALAIRNADAAFPTKKGMAAALGIQRTDLYRYLAFFELPDKIVADLEANPGLLGRHAAFDLAAVIKKHGEKALIPTIEVWTRFKRGGIDQAALASLLEAAMAPGRPARTERDIKKLFVGKEQAGSITRDAGALTIKLRASALNREQEDRLRNFVEELLRG